MKVGDIVYISYFVFEFGDISLTKEEMIEKNIYKVLKVYFSNFPLKIGSVMSLPKEDVFETYSDAAQDLIKKIFSFKNPLKFKKVNEALEVKKIKYKGTRKNYDIHDPNPNILIIDKKYNVDGNGVSILGLNLNYLEKLTKKDKKTLIRDVNKLDNSILGIKGIKAWLRSIFNKGDYDLTTDQKIKRYKNLVDEYPILKKIIRRYKYEGIK
jgi:hypothetical protein